MMACYYLLFNTDYLVICALQVTNDQLLCKPKQCYFGAVGDFENLYCKHIQTITAANISRGKHLRL